MQLLTAQGVDAQGRATYRLAVVNNQLIANSYQTSTSTATSNSDVYQFLVSLRYTFK